MAKSGFSKVSGSGALKRLGSISGKFLGKLANGLEAVEAMKCLADAKPNGFMEKAREAIHVAVKKLETIGTIAYANPDEGFNASMSKAFNVHRNAVAAKAKAAPPKPKRGGPGLVPI